jgi:hypothetical protein
MEPRLTIVTAAAWLAVALAATPAAADEAKELHDHGVKLYKAEKFAEAADAFRRAHGLKPSWKLLYNIGQSEAAAARYGLALEAFEAYLVQGADEVGKKRREEVLAEIKRLRVLVGTIEVETSEEVELRIDGTTRGTAPFEGPIRVAAGKHLVELLMDGEVVLDQHVSVAGGMSTVVSYSHEVDEPPEPMPEPEPTPEPAPAAPPPDDGASGLFVGGIVATVLGAGGLAVGGIFTYKGVKDYDEYEEVSNGGDLERYNELEDEILPRNRALMITGYTVGGALVVTGVVLLVVDRKGDEGPAGAAALIPAPGGLAVTF